MKWRTSREERLITFLQAHLSNHSGKALRKVLDANCCRVNGAVERFGSRRLFRGDVVELSSEWLSLKKPKWTFETLYEDADLRIVNKPAGWICSGENAEKTFGKDLFLVHRLDKETTGALLLAKGEEVREELFQLFEKRAVQKQYLALVDGIPREKEGKISTFLTKKGSYQGQTIWGSGSRGLTATTHWEKLALADRASLLLVTPETGRTHQIRVHLAEMGHPILIDRQYAKTFRSPVFSPRVMLHAFYLSFSFRGKIIEAKAPLFLDMRDVLQSVGVQMGHLRQFLCVEKEENAGNESDCDKETKEVEEVSHLLHESR